MRFYQLSLNAKKDLLEIRRFTVKQWGKKQSENYIQEIKKTFQLIADMPAIGQHCENDIGKDRYYFPSRRHIVYYTFSKNKVLISAILHQNMDHQNYLTLRH
jgi:toxin ParE1/3/4